MAIVIKMNIKEKQNYFNVNSNKIILIHCQSNYFWYESLNTKIFIHYTLMRVDKIIFNVFNFHKFYNFHTKCSIN